MRSESEAGFVAIEWVAAIGLLLLPMVMLVATLPVWAERKHTATVAAREAARVLVRDWPNPGVDVSTNVAKSIAADHGVDARDVDVRVRSVGTDRGSEVRVDVDIVMPAISVAGMHGGAWHYTATAVRRVDDYRSR